MSRPRPASLVAATALVAAIAAPARADITIVSESSAGAKTTLSVDAIHLRAESSGDRAQSGPTVFLFDATTKKAYALRPSERSYFEVTGGVAAMRAQMQEQLKGLPPAQRAMAERMLAERGLDMQADQAAPVEAKLSFKDKGEKRTVGSFRCEMYAVEENGKATEEVCVSPFGAATVTREDAETFRKLAEAISTAMGVKGRAPVRDFSKYPGFPVQRITRDETGASRTETVKSVSHAKLAKDAFTIPAGFTQSAATGR